MNFRFCGKLPGVLFLGACASNPQVDSLNPITPGWLLKPPSQFFSKQCALGRSSATLFREDARIHAAESARVALAEADSVRVRSTMIDVQTNSSSSGSGDQIVQVSEITKDAILRNSDIIEYFFDESGAFSGGERRVTFAVACLR